MYFCFGNNLNSMKKTILSLISVTVKGGLPDTKKTVSETLKLFTNILFEIT